MFLQREMVLDIVFFWSGSLFSVFSVKFILEVRQPFEMVLSIPMSGKISAIFSCFIKKMTEMIGLLVLQNCYVGILPHIC